MPDNPQNYNTRLRTNAQILLPRRLRNEPSPPAQHRRSSKAKNIPQSLVPPPQFPPPNTRLHPDDAVNKTFLAIGRTFLAIDNRALTIKDLSHLILQHGLVCQNASAASQAITTFIRNHLSRCREDGSQPLLLSLPLSGTDDDDRLVPALHSRSGGTSASIQTAGSTLTNFRRGTSVWYLSEAAGAPCPFKRAGLSIDADTTSGSNKRKRDSRRDSPRKLRAQGPAMGTRHHQNSDEDGGRAITPPRIKLTISMRNLSPLSSSDSSDSEDSPNKPGSASESGMPTRNTLRDSSDDSSEVDSSDSVDEPEFIPDVKSYPPPYIIPSSSCSTPSTSLASPSVPFSDSFSTFPNLCSTHFPKTTFISHSQAKLSNPLPNDRGDSSTPPISPASPPPDSEDEDNDFHNSMVGLRRDSRTSLMQDTSVSMLMPTSPQLASDSCHRATHDWDLEDFVLPKHEDTVEDNATHLALPTDFVPFFLEPELNRVSVKDEPGSDVLPATQMVSIKQEQLNNGTAVFHQTEVHLSCSYLGNGSKADPVRIDIVGDVEVLGPESVRSREWDAAWGSTECQTSDMDVDSMADVVMQSRSQSPFDGSIECPSSTQQKSVLSPSAPQSGLSSDEAIVVYPIRSCEVNVTATVIDGIPVYRTFIAPDAPLIRRMDNSLVNITLLQSFLQVPLSTLLCDVSSPRLTISRGTGLLGGTWAPLAVAQSIMHHFSDRIPQGTEETFLSEDLDVLFPNAMDRLLPSNNLEEKHEHVTHDGQLSHGVKKDACIRVEDLFTADPGDTKHKRLKSDVCDSQTKGVSLPSSLELDAQRGRDSSVSTPLSEQEERLFHSFVDVLGVATGHTKPTTVPLSTAPVCSPISMSISSSPLSTPPTSPVLKPAVVSVPSSSQGKENEKVNKARPVRRKKREKPDVPVRRSKRALGSDGPMTRSRSRGN